MELRVIILRMCDEITKDICRRVITNMGIYVPEVVGQNSGYVKHGIRESNFHESFFAFVDIYV